MLKKILATLAIALTVGCATKLNTSHTQLLGYETVTRIVMLADALVKRGRISVEQATKVVELAETARTALDFVNGLSATCVEKTTCTQQDQLQLAQDILSKLEAEMAKGN